MLKKLTNNQLLRLYLNSKSLIKRYADFENKENYRYIFSKKKPGYTTSKTAIYNRLVGLSKELKNRNFTEFSEWYDYSNWKNSHHFVMKDYENKSACLSFSLN